MLHEDLLYGGLNGLARVFFGSSCLLQCFEDGRIFICTLFTIFGRSGRSQFLLSLWVCLAGLLVLDVESSLGNYLQSFLNMG